MRNLTQLPVKQTNSFTLLKAICLVVITLLCITDAQAQDQSTIAVTGTIYSKIDNTPLPGASIVLKNTARGTETDFNGKFNIQNVNIGDKLTIHFMGFTKKEVTVTNTLKPLQIYLNEDGVILGTVQLGAADTRAHYKTKRGFLKRLF